jgi:raffinose/stachyose/melibiose transport system substrate-binding protein
LADAVESDLNIKLEFDDSVATYQWENLVRTRLAIGDMADIFRYHSGSLLYAISPAKNAIDLTDFPFADKLAEPFRNAVSSDGKVYGIPYDFSVDVYYWIYNKTTYDKLNLNPPDNWDEFMSNCEVIRNNGLEPITESYNNAWRSQLVLLNDTYSIVSQVPDFAEDLSANRTRYSLEPVAVRSFEKVAQVGTYLNPDNKTLTSSEQYEKLKSGEINHAIVSANRRFQLLQENPEMSDIYGFFPQPGESVESSGFTV